MLIDWALAERVATTIASRLPAAELLPTDSLDGLIPEIEQRIEQETGLRSLQGPASFEIVDRPAWIAANVRSFQHLLHPLLERVEGQVSPFGASITKRVTGVEVGTLLGWMSGRVLGQYDLLVGQQDGGARSDAVYLVGPNLAMLERRFGFDAHQFRTWVLIHELTHRAQFTGVPWMRAHFSGLVEESLGLADANPQAVLAALREAVRDRDQARQQLREFGVMGVIATPEQRAVIARISGLMSLLEGHGDLVMTRAAGPLVADAARFERVLRARRSRGNPLSKLIQRLMGIEAKLNQYAAGARFIGALEVAGGTRLIDRCWEGPEHLPSMDEIRDPQRWLARLGIEHASR